MADGKVNIRFSSIADMGGFAAVSDGYKNLGRKMKDFGDAGNKAVSALAAKFRNDLTVALGDSFSILTEMAHGGIWGVMGAIATKVVNGIAEKIEEARKKAKELADIIRSEAALAVAGLDKNVKSLAASMAEATGNVEKMLAAANRETDAGTRRGSAALRLRAAKGELSPAEAKYEETMLRLNAEREKSVREVKSWDGRMQRTHADFLSATSNLAAAREAQAKFADDNAAVLERHAALKADAEADYSGSILDPNQRRKVVAGYVAALRKFEEENKETLERQKKVDEHLATATEALAKVKECEAALRKKWTDALDRQGVAEKDIEAARIEEEARQRKAKEEADIKANEEYARAEREFAEQLRREEKEARDRKIAAMRGSAEKMQEEASALDMAIDAQRKLANEWEANALKARGRDFGDVERERRDDAEGKAAAAFARRNRADERRAQRIAAAGRHARPEDRAWLARFREWRDAQDPRNNPAAKAAEALQKRRDALQQDIKKTLDDIKAELKTANTFG